jgi:3-hydroxyisobutyrate dehydrogenase
MTAPQRNRGSGLRVGFVGLGQMGAPMCACVARAGFPVTAFDLRPEATAAAVAAGARAGAGAAGCAREADVLITMLPGPAEVEDVLLGAGGALAALPRGAVAVDMGTGSGDVGRRVLEAARPRGIGVLDAPVADALRAPEGLLTIFVGGEEADVARVRPVLEAMGDPDRITHVGPHGAGATVKLLVNLQWFVHAAAAAEALVVGARAGLDVETLHRALATGPSRSSFLEHEALEVLRGGGYGERFPLGLVARDLRLTLDVMRGTGIPVGLSERTLELYEQARAAFGDAAGEMAVVQLYEQLAGARLRFGGAAGDGR